MANELTNPGFGDMSLDFNKKKSFTDKVGEGIGDAAKSGQNAEDALLSGLTAANPIIGGVAMGLKAALGVASANKQRKREAEVMYHNKAAQIESQNSANKSQILNALGSNLAATLRR